MIIRGGGGKQIESFHVFVVCERARERERRFSKGEREKRERRRGVFFFLSSRPRVVSFPLFYYTSVTEHEFYAVLRALRA